MIPALAEIGESDDLAGLGRRPSCDLISAPSTFCVPGAKAFLEA